MSTTAQVTEGFNSRSVQLAPEDALYQLMRTFRQDTNHKKIDLGIGAYRDDYGRPWILPVDEKVC